LIFVAPEGTRSPNGELQTFKKGPFWLARDCEAPIVPVVISGAHQLMPKGSFRPRRGVIRVRILPRMPVSALASDDVAAQAEALRTLYQQTLDHMRRGTTA
jgi:1-acyl-sn-glycerol-3-phosphate acyltransferase